MHYTTTQLRVLSEDEQPIVRRLASDCLEAGALQRLAEQEVRLLLGQVAELEAALKFYADPANYDWGAMDDDKGKVARAALRGEA
jgi:3-methyladenine DNA glycosylase AlkC